MLRAALFAPLTVYLALCVALIVRQSRGDDPDQLRLLVSGAGSFVLYFYAGLLVLSVFHLSLPRRALGSVALPVVLFLFLAAMDLFGGERGGSGGFISLDFNCKTFWLLPGMFLSRPLQNIVIDSPPTGPHLTSSPRMIINIRGALAARDGSLVLAGIVSRQGLSIDWRLLSRLDAQGNLDGSFAPQPATLPDLEFIRSRRDGLAIINWRDGSTNKIGTVAANGAITNLFDLSPVTSPVFSVEPLTDATMDAAGRIVLAAKFEKPSPEGAGYSKVNYPLARFDTSGQPDPTFSMPEVPRFFDSGRVSIAPDGGIAVTYRELDGIPRLRLLLPDGRPNAAFESGLAQTLRTLDHGPVRAFDIDPAGRILAVLKNEPLEEFLLVRLGLDGRTLGRATIPGNMGDAGSVLNHPDGSVFVIVGNKKTALSDFKWPWCPTLLRFHPDLSPDEAFNAKAAALGQEFGEMNVLGTREGGGVIVSLYHSQRESCVLYLARDGSVEKRVQF